jgi:hypothetical protein
MVTSSGRDHEAIVSAVPGCLAYVLSPTWKLFGALTPMMASVMIMVQDELEKVNDALMEVSLLSVSHLEV